MPKLPDVTALGERSAPQAQMGVVSYRPTSGAEELPGTALAQSAKEVEQHMMAAQEQVDTVRAEDAFTQLRQRQIDLTSGENGFMQKKGGDAVNQPILKDYTNQLNDASKEISDGLGNERQRDLFNRRAQVASLQFQQDLLQHVSRERDVYSKEVFKSGVDIELQNAALRYQDPAGIALSQERIKGLIQQEATRNGWTDDVTKDALFRTFDQMHSDITEKYVAENDLPGAERYLQGHKNELDPKTELHLENLLRSRRNEQASELRVTIQDRLQDMEAMGVRGVVPPQNFITPSEVDAAYPKNPQQAAIVKRRVQNAYTFASQASGMPSMSDDQILQVVKNAAPSSERPDNFAEETQHQAKLQMLASSIIKTRRDDTMAFASLYGEQLGLPKVNDLNPNDMDAFIKELQNRAKIANLLHDRFGSPIKLFAKSEVPMFSEMIKSVPLNQRMGFLLTVSKVGDKSAYRGIMQELAPDDPVTAVAGLRADFGDSNKNLSAMQASQAMLRGQAILRQDKKEDGQPVTGKLLPMPKDKDLLADFEDYTGNSFSGNEEVRNALFQSARAIYAKISVDDKGDFTGEYDSSRWKQSMQMAMGNVEKWNGKKTVLPYGYDKGQFKNELRQRSYALVQSGALNEKVSVDDLYDMPLVPAGDGKYSFQSGNALLADKNGQRVVVDFNTPLPVAKEPKAVHTRFGSYEVKQ